MPKFDGFECDSCGEVDRHQAPRLTTDWFQITVDQSFLNEAAPVIMIFPLNPQTRHKDQLLACCPTCVRAIVDDNLLTLHEEKKSTWPTPSIDVNDPNLEGRN